MANRLTGKRAWSIAGYVIRHGIPQIALTRMIRIEVKGTVARCGQLIWRPSDRARLA